MRTLSFEHISDSLSNLSINEYIIYYTKKVREHITISIRKTQKFIQENREIRFRTTLRTNSTYKLYTMTFNLSFFFSQQFLYNA